MNRIILPTLLGTLLLASQSAEANPSRVYDSGPVQFGPAKPVRDGFMAGASIGRGSIDIECDNCDGVAPVTEALSLTAHAGYMITPRLALLGEHWTVRYNDRGSEWFDDAAPHLIAQRVFAVAGQAFVTDRVWLKAGFGFGWHISDSHYAKGGPPVPPQGGAVPAAGVGAAGGVTPMDSTDRTGASPAYFVASGFEFAHNEFFAADVQVRVGATRRPQDEYQIYNTAVNVGFNWY